MATTANYSSEGGDLWDNTMFTPMHALNDPNAMKDYNFLPSVGLVALELTANDAINKHFSYHRLLGRPK